MEKSWNGLLGGDISCSLQGHKEILILADEVVLWEGAFELFWGGPKNMHYLYPWWSFLSNIEGVTDSVKVQDILLHLKAWESRISQNISQLRVCFKGGRSRPPECKLRDHASRPPLGTCRSLVYRRGLQRPGLCLPQEPGWRLARWEERVSRSHCSSSSSETSSNSASTTTTSTNCTTWNTLPTSSFISSTSDNHFIPWNLKLASLALLNLKKLSNIILVQCWHLEQIVEIGFRFRCRLPIGQLTATTFCFFN